ncbi:MAG: phosphoglycerate dehydrogenase [Hyphomonadaceae bacterium]|nr:phosphoglycerate dehydrogenase [Hyphomonadaceae bacterium]
MSTPPRKVVVTQKFFDDDAIAFLKANRCEVEIAQLPEGTSEAQLSPDQIEGLLAGAGGWIVGHARITREVQTRLPDLAIVSRRGVGFEKVDTEAAEDLGKVVTIAAGGNDASVADQVIGMMISIGRRFREAQEAMNDGSWNILVGTELYRKTVGIVGLGRIGRSLAKRLQGFEARVLVCTPNLSATDIAEFGLIESDFDSIVEQADYISVHAPLTDETRHLFNTDVFARMKRSAVLINTARGGLVSDADLLAALESKQILGAGLDVYESETNPALKPVTEALIKLPNVIAAPHAGASTDEALKRTNMIAAQCAVDVLDGRDPPAQCVVADGRKTIVSN